MNVPFIAEQNLDLSDDHLYEAYECLISEAAKFESRHSGSGYLDDRMLSDLAMLALRFGRNSEVAYALTKQAYSCDSAETAFWFMSNVSPSVELINDTCRAVDRLLGLINNAPDADLAEEARCWAEDFSMEQPDDERIELKFSTLPPTAAANSKSLPAGAATVASSV